MLDFDSLMTKAKLVGTSDCTGWSKGFDHILLHQWVNESEIKRLVSSAWNSEKQ